VVPDSHEDADVVIERVQKLRPNWEFHKNYYRDAHRYDLVFLKDTPDGQLIVEIYDRTDISKSGLGVHKVKGIYAKIIPSRGESKDIFHYRYKDSYNYDILEDYQKKIVEGLEKKELETRTRQEETLEMERRELKNKYFQ